MKVSLLLLLLLIFGIPRERLRPAAWLISVEFRIPVGSCDRRSTEGLRIGNTSCRQGSRYAMQASWFPHFEML